MSRARPLLLIVLLALLIPAPAEAATYRSCAGGDPDNGISAVRVLRIGCADGLAVAKRTNSVKCFLNGTRCTHRFRGRAWTCTLRHGRHVHCAAGTRHVRYRLG